jgi:eukaryotic-like serine/threonine-protein kinase
MAAGDPSDEAQGRGSKSARDVLLAALELQGREREAFLETACAGDEALRQTVERLLAAHDRAAGFLETPASALEDDLRGQPIGSYRVQREIGRGGMGTVYLAERADGAFLHRVAIKIIKRGMDSEAVLRHFRNERQILATLEHPHIARLLDGGSTAAGTPYFVMEYVEGEPIDRYCQARGLGVGERVDLFREAAAAVSYAHQRLVVHRDIKPSNILVGTDGVPKLLDFGIAKILTPDLDPAARSTATTFHLMTPAYASPEQLAGKPSTTLTDVYSLGVVLDELLLGVPRGARSGDLENIVAMARRPESERRYASVDQLSEDLRRYRIGLPVAARQDRWSYRLGKFVRRHRVAVAAAALLVLALLGGAIATAWQARRARAQQALAERRFADVRKLAHAVLFDYHDAIQALPGATPVRERLVRDGLEYLDSLAREKTNDLSLQREVASAYERVGDVQGGALSANLGDTAGARASYRRAAVLRDELEQVAAADPGVTAALRDELARERAGGHLKLALVESYAGDLETAVAEAARAIQILERLASQPGGEALRFELAAAHDHAGTLALDGGDATGALLHHRRAAQLYETLPAEERRSPRARRELTMAYVRLGQALIEAGSLEQALVQVVRAREIGKALATEFPLDAELQSLAGMGNYYAGDTLERMGRHGDALVEFESGLGVAERMAAEDPGNARRLSDLSFARIRVANALVHLGRHREALPLYSSCLQQRSKEVAADPVDLWKRASWIEAQARKGLTLAHLGQHAAARSAAETALALMDQTAVEPSNLVIRAAFTEIDRALGQAFAIFGGDTRLPHEARVESWQRARALYGRSAEFWSGLRSSGQLSAGDAGKPAELAAEVTRCDQALAALAAGDRGDHSASR